MSLIVVFNTNNFQMERGKKEVLWLAIFKNTCQLWKLLLYMYALRLKKNVLMIIKNFV